MKRFHGLFQICVTAVLLACELGLSQLHAQGLRGELFFDGSDDPRLRDVRIESISVDSQDRFLVVSSQDCDPGPVCFRINAISAGGELLWQTPVVRAQRYLSPPYFRSSLQVGPNDRTYFYSGGNIIYAFDSFGSPVSGWPVSVTGAQIYGHIVDNQDGAVYLHFDTGTGISIVALDPSGAVKWRRNYPGTIPGYTHFVQGPGKNIYIEMLRFLIPTGNLFVVLDYRNGNEVCQRRLNPIGSVNMVADSDNVFALHYFILSATIEAFDANCQSRNIFSLSNRYIGLERLDQGRIFIIEGPVPRDPNTLRFMAVDRKGGSLWRNERIISPDRTNKILAIKNNVLYILGQDTADSDRQKLFLVDADSGKIFNSIETAPQCDAEYNCGVAVADDGTIYLNDSSATKIYKITRVPEEFRILNNFPGNEPSIAADPNDPLHAVAGFNSGTACAWLETIDGGRSWTPTDRPGEILFPSGFHSQGDPWVRFDPDGQLFYSCIAHTNWSGNTRTNGVFVAKSETGYAGDFGIAHAVTTRPEYCEGEPLCRREGEFIDHPSITVIQRPGGSRLVACWIAALEPTYRKYVDVSFSDNGTTWSMPPIPLGGPDANVCTIGGSNSNIAVTWWDAISGTLKLRASTDGEHWLPAIDLAAVGQLVGGQSTHNTLVSPPYTLTFPNSEGLGFFKAVWQVREDDASRVYYGEELIRGGWSSNRLGDPRTEKFLPGTGTCPQLIGAYETGDSPTTFKYKVWWLDNSDPNGPIFISGRDSDSLYGDLTGSFRRIGDYTSVDCWEDTIVWAAWTEAHCIREPCTDERNKTTEIWGARIPLPRQ